MAQIGAGVDGEDLGRVQVAPGRLLQEHAPASGGAPWAARPRAAACQCPTNEREAIAESDLAGWHRGWRRRVVGVEPWFELGSVRLSVDD